MQPVKTKPARNGSVFSPGAPLSRAEVVLMTPALASQLLENNPDNRNVRWHWVNTLASAMASGHWILNNQGIGLDEAGRVLDGQHRLLAVVQSGCSVQMLVVRALPRSAQATVDLNQKRNISDALVIQGLLQPKHAKRVVEVAIALGLFLGLPNKTPEQIESILSLVPGDVLPVVETLTTPAVISCATVRAACVLARSLDADLIDQFILEIRNGINLGPGHPSLALRNYLLNSQRVARSFTSDTQRYELFLRTAATIHARLRGDKLQIPRPSLSALQVLLRGRKIEIDFKKLPIHLKFEKRFESESRS